MKTIKIAHLYYDLMNLYGENGNIRFLKKKLEDQNINVEVHFLTIGDKIDFDKYDFYYLGAGSEENALIVLDDLINYRDDIKRILDKRMFLVTGNSLDLFGEKIRLKDKELDGLNIFEYIVKEEEFRIVGEQYYESNIIDKAIIGFQNRSCSMSEYGNPLFKVIDGCGFNPNSMNEGFKVNYFFGTYLLGPILVRNPYFCDYIVNELCNLYNIKYKNPNYEDYAYKAYDELIKNFYSNK